MLLSPIVALAFLTSRYNFTADEEAGWRPGAMHEEVRSKKNKGAPKLILNSSD